MPETTCAWCGAQFHPNRSNHKCCSLKCNVRWQNNRRAQLPQPLRPPRKFTTQQFVCGRCGVQFAGRGERKYCSRLCANLEHFSQPDRACEVCGQNYRYTYSKQRTCSRACGVELRRLEDQRNWPTCKISVKTCVQCGSLFTCHHSTKITCSKTCGYQYNKQATIDRYHSDPAHRDYVLANSHARRADKLGLGSKKITLTYLCERDHWRCGICHKPIRAKQGPMRPSIDHIIPLSRGGTHDLVNVQAAHYRCNLSKNATGVGDQLILFG